MGVESDVLRADITAHRIATAKPRAERIGELGGPIGIVDRPRCPRFHVDSNGVQWQCALLPIVLPHGGSCLYPEGYEPPKGGRKNPDARVCIRGCCDKNGKPIKDLPPL